jgi:hypothetical protein
LGYLLFCRNKDLPLPHLHWELLELASALTSNPSHWAKIQCQHFHWPDNKIWQVTLGGFIQSMVLGQTFKTFNKLLTEIVKTLE